MTTENKPPASSNIMAIGIVVVGLTGFFQAANLINSYIGHQTGTDTKRQIEPTQTADITRLQTDIAAIRANVEATNQRWAEFNKWKDEEMRAIADLRARVLNLERQK